MAAVVVLILARCVAPAGRDDYCRASQLLTFALTRVTLGPGTDRDMKHSMKEHKGYIRGGRY